MYASSYQRSHHTLGDFAESAREESSLLGNDNLNKKRGSDSDDAEPKENGMTESDMKSSSLLSYLILGLLLMGFSLYFIMQHIMPGEFDRISEWIVDSGFLHSYILILTSSIGEMQTCLYISIAIAKLPSAPTL